MTSRYIALLKECELSVGVAAINIGPLPGLLRFFYDLLRDQIELPI